MSDAAAAVNVQLERPGLDPKSFYRRVEAILDAIPVEASPRRFARKLSADLLEAFGDGLGLCASQVYERRKSHVRLVEHRGRATLDLSSELERRLVDPGPDGIGEIPWSGEVPAGSIGIVGVTGREAMMVVLHFDDPAIEASGSLIHSVVSPLHYAVIQHLRRRELEDVIEQSRAIQLSLLPARAPAFGEFDIAAASVPAERVGGDFYDFLPVDSETLALTVADASGHGLPAALQARDVATGLRMAVERDLKVTRTIEKLNRVIHRSGLVSRFVSLVFGELEINGNLTYVNAGHPPALLLDDRGVHELAIGGMLLGPHPETRYKLGFAHVDRGAALVFYTDGVTEREGDDGSAFGMKRLAAWLADWRRGPADRAVGDLLERLRAFGSGRPFEDDVTVLFVRRP